MVLENVDESMITMRDETFGPIVAVARVESVEAIEKATLLEPRLDCSGLDARPEQGAGDRFPAGSGTVTINDHLMSHGLGEVYSRGADSRNWLLGRTTKPSAWRK